ncbi:MAG TPA: hypothetical protein VN278_07115, partial [Methanosarcina sp.]|nr:hypothetical protein [Methanosarcina sp.]
EETEGRTWKVFLGLKEKVARNKKEIAKENTTPEIPLVVEQKPIVSSYGTRVHVCQGKVSEEILEILEKEGY